MMPLWPEREVTVNDKKVIAASTVRQRTRPDGQPPVDITAQLTQTVMETGTTKEIASVDPL